MFFIWFAGAVLAIVVLAWIGGMIAKRAPGTEWEKHEDRPIVPYE